MDANGPIICRFPEDFGKIPSISFYQNYLNSQATNCTNTIGKCSYVQLYHIAGLGTFFDLCDGLCFCLAWFWRCFFFGLFYGCGAACEHLQTKELTYIENNWDNHKGNHPDRSERSEDKGSIRLITRSLQGHGQSKLTRHVRHAIVDAALFQHLSRKMKNAHQNPNSFGFACSAAGLFPFPFGGPFDGPLPAPFGCNHRCLRVHRHRKDWKWIRLNMVE